MSEPNTHEEMPELSLVRGGVLFNLWRVLRLSGPELEFVERRVVVTVAIVWLPLLVLSLIGGNAVGTSVKVPFLSDVMAHTRFLIAVPVLVGGDLLVHRRIGSRIRNFLRRNIIIGDDVSKFRAAIESAHRMRDSVLLEVALLLSVYTLGILFWSRQMTLPAPTWYAEPSGSILNLTHAGYWFAFVSVPILQFLLLRYYARLVIWSIFLWRISRLHLHLVATHPDRTGGLSFLGKCTYAVGPLLFAQGALLSGFIANEVLYNGQSLLGFKVEAMALVRFFTAAVFLPMTVFSFKLLKEKRRGLNEYGRFASGYVADFDRKWIKGINPSGEEPLGSGDIQSLADLGNSYTVVREMTIVPFGVKDVARVAAASIVPLLPLLLLVFSLSEVLDRALKILF
jgi:hypothetical protein